MSVRVNLLPQAAVEHQAVARQKTFIAVGGVVLVAALGATTVWQNGRIDDADRQLATEQDHLLTLQGEVLRLDEFADLGTQTDRNAALIEQALAGEVSLAGILQDVAAVMPSDAEFETLSIAVAPEDATPGQATPSLGTLTASGRSANDHAPGVERLLLEFDKVAGFHDPFLTNSALEDVDETYPQFSFQAQLGPEVLTGRYLDGLPEELR